MITEKTTYPIEYKVVPVQHAFLVSSDGTLQIRQVTKVEREMKFKSEKEARKFIRNYKVQL